VPPGNGEGEIPDLELHGRWSDEEARAYSAGRSISTAALSPTACTFNHLLTERGQIPGPSTGAGSGVEDHGRRRECGYGPIRVVA
jgi:hypothetical protein